MADFGPKKTASTQLKVTTTGGATASSSHSFTEEETFAFADWVRVSLHNVL